MPKPLLLTISESCVQMKFRYGLMLLAWFLQVMELGIGSYRHTGYQRPKASRGLYPVKVLYLALREGKIAPFGSILADLAKD